MGKIAKIALGVIAGLFVIGNMTGGGEKDTTATTAEAAVVAPATEKAQAPKAHSKEQEPKPEPVVDAVAVKAGTILKEFEGNEAAADLKYDGKTLKVTGTVDKVDTEVWDEDQYVVQLNTASKWDILTVNCNDMTADEVATLATGSTATVVGQFDDGGDLGVELTNCTLAGPGADKAQAPKAQAQSKQQDAVEAVVVEAKDILKEFEGNEAAADLKYDGKTLKVTGTVDKVDTEFWNAREYVVQLNSASKWDILTVNCNDMTADEAATLTKGSTTTVVGRFDDGGDLGVELKDCTLVK